MTRTAIVTGGTGGLGSAVTAALLDAGWRVVVPWVTEAELARVPEHERLALVRADLLEQDGPAAVVAAADGRLDALVNLVGGFAQPGLVGEAPLAEFERMLRLNLVPTYAITAAALPLLLDGGGAVVCTAASAALHPFPGASGYLVAKRGVLAFVDVLHAEYGDRGIAASALLPTVIDTPANREAMPDADRATWQQPADLAATVLHLLGDPAGERRASVHVPGA
ncbi:SDR family NAD(P)-dependent oxidoreductase [Patulibacter brassicae]|uniref:SDR family NAD(P)-dependent oxidoreductase n=1 Tax=Patulibacter brassicae TaxID=1705717 RepID=A0ABU4VL14_9ACTN|nr:SDR family NAD(P)-dependent oxidoreductase [Patulibacter brassicae]MDX8151621.1 SDR family NAD(P)-dependent oxidoreductase [Patulibacter brassicae]